MSNESVRTIPTRRRTAVQLVSSGAVQQEQLYIAALALARLQDRGHGRSLTISDMCEVLGYVEEEEQEQRAA